MYVDYVEFSVGIYSLEGHLCVDKLAARVLGSLGGASSAPYQRRDITAGVPYIQVGA